MLKLHLSSLRHCYAGEGLSALESVPAMQRRRLSALAKLALNVAIETVNEQAVDYIVWASCYGDETKTYGILKDVLTDQTPSPTQFSTSVHNAIGGLYSILCQDDTISTSLSCSWSKAMIEAYAILKTQPQVKRVMVVFYEEPLPEIYDDKVTFDAFAMSAVVSLEAPNLSLKGLISSQEIEALGFYAFWNASEQHAWRGWHKLK